MKICRKNKKTILINNRSLAYILR